jgi:hypothetical protein
MRQIDIINQQLSVEQDEAYRDNVHGMLADLAITDGNRFVQPYEGFPVATSMRNPVRFAPGVEPLASTLRPYNTNLVFEYVDGRNHAHPYVGPRSLNAFHGSASNRPYAHAVYGAFDAIKAWCPDEMLVHTDQGKKLGIRVEALPNIARLLADHRMTGKEVGAPGRPTGLTLKEQKVFIEFCTSVLTPSDKQQ